MPPLPIMASYVLASVAIAMAVTISIATILLFAIPGLGERIPSISLEDRGNLAVAVLFFWIEVTAVVVGVRLFDSRLDSANRRRNREALKSLIMKLGDDVDDARYKFAVALDTNVERGLYYNTNMNQLNADLGNLRADVLEFFLRRENLGRTEGFIFDRIMRCLDIVIADTYRRCLVANKLNTQIRDVMRSIPEGEPTPPEVAAKKEQLEDILSKMFDDSSAQVIGIAALARTLEAAGNPAAN